MNPSYALKLEAEAASPPDVLFQPLARDRQETVCLVALWLSIAYFVYLFLSLTFRLYDRFTIMAYDLGIFDQAAWLISHGKTPFVTVRGLHLLADHFSVILYLLAPLYWLFPTPKTLLCAQTLALAAGALPLYALARARLGSPFLGLVFAVTYLSFPPMHWAAAFEFHPEEFATPLLLAAFLFLTRGQWGLYFAMLTLAALTKENVGLTIVALGLYGFFKISRRIGVLTMALGILGMVVAMITVRAFNHGAPSSFFALYNRLGSSPGQMAGFVIQRPLSFGALLIGPLNRWYLFQLFFPFLLLIALAPDILLIAVPALVTNMLSNRYVMHTIAHQYTAFITPFIFIAMIVGFDRCRRRGNRASVGLMLAYLGVCVWFGSGHSPLHVWRGRVIPGLSRNRVPEVRQTLSQIPPQASVSAQGTLMAHLTHRRQVYPFPNPFVAVASGYGARALRQMELEDYAPYSPAQRRQAFAAAPVEYIALCPRTTTYPLTPALYEEYAVTALQSDSYGIIAIGKNAVLLRRGADHQQGLRLLAEQAGKPISTGEDVERAFRAWTRGLAFTV